MSKEKKSRNTKIVKLWEKGLSYRNIAKIHKIHHTTVEEIVKRLIKKPGDK